MGFFKDRKSDHADAKTLKTAGLGAVTDMKAMAAQLQEQFAGAIQSAQMTDSAAQAPIGQRINHLMANGVESTAMVNAVRDLGAGAIPNCSSMEFDLTLTAGPGAPRNLTVRQEITTSAASYAPGQQIAVIVDPNNPDDAMVGSKAIPGGSDTRMMMLERLAALHEGGALTDEEFAAKKAAVLAQE